MIKPNEILRFFNPKVTGLGLLFFVTLAYFLFLGSRPLFVPDEGRYAEIAREMAATGDFITPYLNYIKYFEKPPLFYWMGALTIKIAGVNLWSLRSINALLGILGCLFTYYTASKLYNVRTGLLAALILASSPLYFVMSHMITLDLPVSVFIMSSLYCFILAIQEETRHQKYWLWLAAGSAALAVLTKGLIGIILPGLIVLVWLASLKKLSELKNLYLSSSFLIFFIIAVPWHVLVSHYNPEFPYFYFIEQQFFRYTHESIGHYQPAWYFLPILLIGFFPWLLFLPLAIKRSLVKFNCSVFKANDWFFVCWFILIFLFFSFSKSKLIPYILPIFPALSLIIARYFDHAIRHPSRESSLIFGITVAFSCLIAVLFYRFSFFTLLPHPLLSKIFLMTAVSILTVGLLISFVWSFKSQKGAIYFSIISMLSFLILGVASVAYFDTRSIQPLAHIVNQLSSQNEVIAFNRYYQDLPFYLQRRVSILNWKNELTFGSRHQDASAWLLGNAQFSHRMASNQPSVIILDRSDFNHLKSWFPNIKFKELGKTTTTIIVQPSYSILKNN
ncbi:MAG: glycosyltransferase family 39 protein [Gammaproteobacteria bacterium]|nr:glycosyltransferase family 39 protein [Gammaproteobacteria bacterium]